MSQEAFCVPGSFFCPELSLPSPSPSLGYIQPSLAWTPPEMSHGCPSPLGQCNLVCNTHRKVGRVDPRGWQCGLGVRGAVGRLQGFCPFLHLHLTLIVLGVSLENPSSRGLFPRQGWVIPDYPLLAWKQESVPTAFVIGISHFSKLLITQIMKKNDIWNCRHWVCTTLWADLPRVCSQKR